MGKLCEFYQDDWAFREICMLVCEALKIYFPIECIAGCGGVAKIRCRGTLSVMVYCLQCLHRGRLFATCGCFDPKICMVIVNLVKMDY